MDNSFQSHFDLLQSNRMRHSRQKSPDISDVTLHLDGKKLRDIPDLFLQLGEQINGPGGYFGACLDSLDDCLCGDFGLKHPITVQVSHWDDLRRSLSGQAIDQWWQAESRLKTKDNSEEMGGHVRQREVSDQESYWDWVCEVLSRRGVIMVRSDDV